MPCHCEINRRKATPFGQCAISFVVLGDMRIKLLLFFVLVLTALSSLAQVRSDSLYTRVGADILGVDAPPGQILNAKGLMWGASSFDYAVLAFSNILRDNLNNKKAMQRMELLRQQSIAKLELILLCQVTLFS